jgi:hypothetical protein
MPHRRTNSAIPSTSRRRHTKSAPASVPAQTPNIHLEPPHDDSDPICASKFPFAQIIPNWSSFDPNTKNPAIGTVFSSAHHGRSGGKSVRDFTKFDLACCLEWIDKKVDREVYRVRCMNVFTVESAQCTTHRKVLYKGGPNSIYEKLRKGKDVCWGDIKDRG